MKLGEIKRLVKHDIAKDVTTVLWEDINAIRKSSDVIGYSVGVYGVNGALLRNRETGELYAITSRSGNLFVVI